MAALAVADCMRTGYTRCLQLDDRCNVNYPRGCVTFILLRLVRMRKDCQLASAINHHHAAPQRRSRSRSVGIREERDRGPPILAWAKRAIGTRLIYLLRVAPAWSQCHFGF